MAKTKKKKKPTKKTTKLDSLARSNEALRSANEKLLARLDQERTQRANEWLRLDEARKRFESEPGATINEQRNIIALRQDEIAKLTKEKAELETTLSLATGEAARLTKEKEDWLNGDDEQIEALEATIAERDEEIKRLGQQLEEARAKPLDIQLSEAMPQPAVAQPFHRVNVEVRITS